MKKQTLALLLALLMALSAFTVIAEGQQPQPADPVLGSVNGVEFTKSQVAAQIPTFLEYQYIADATDYRAVLEVMIQREVLRKKIADLGFDQFTAEEDAAFAAEAQKQWDEAVNYYADYSQSADTTQAREDALRQANELLSSQGFTQEMLIQSLRDNAATDRMQDYLMGGYQPTGEEIQKVFQEVGASYQESFANNIGQYEYMTQYAGQSSWYTPEGYRGVVHILLTVDETLMKNYQDLSAALEEQEQAASEVPLDNAETTETAEAPETPEATEKPVVTREMVDAARQAAMDSRKADIDLINERLQRGDNFLDLIKEYGEDPGMTVEENLQNGYSVHAQSIVYDPVFTAAAFSEKMQKPGDVSDPVLGNFGIHIVQYLRDVPSGLIMTDAIHSEISDYLVNVKQNEVFGQAFETWKTQEAVVYHEEAIAQAIAEAAQQQVQSPEELPLEALPGVEDDDSAAPEAGEPVEEAPAQP